MLTDLKRQLVLTDQNFDAEVIQRPIPILVDFWAFWCGPCQLMNPIHTDLADKYEGRIRIGKVNVDEQPEVSARYQIQSIPTLLLFKSGRIFERIVGAMPKSLLVEKLDALFTP
ncbi:MAG: thioredoxin [Nitrospira sp.]